MESFDVIFTGRVLPGTDAQQAALELSRLADLDVEVGLVLRNPLKLPFMFSFGTW